jgi:DNA-binding CsgD family transcriptional regulator
VSAPIQPLSPRQREVLALLADGIQARDIGVRLGLSEATVRNHIRGVLRRLDCHSQLQAVARARELHLV